MEVVCARIANEADERALQTHEALNRMEQSIESIWRGMQMLLERDAAQLAPPTHPSRGRTVDDLLKDGVDALVQRLWNVRLTFEFVVFHDIFELSAFFDFRSWFWFSFVVRDGAGSCGALGLANPHHHTC